ncbi:hypothetical protein FHS68_004560 [Dyadobacter arcticus]|uniref:Uncharacterized protein n=1 Tax=Dyadobacter arcticus TaxID=1078754 RepID=A0ABX0UWQ7_9BACT|nr:hypothetical protein [Dyadobacter arcticus]
MNINRFLSLLKRRPSGKKHWFAIVLYGLIVGIIDSYFIKVDRNYYINVFIAGC